MHYYKRNIGDYHKKAGRLTMLQHGAFTLLMDACYDRERFPTIDDALEWLWASSKEEIEAVEFVLKRFFVEKDGVFVQKRIEEEISRYHKQAETNKRIAIERETKRREKRTKRARGVDESNTLEHEAPPNQEPLTINQEPKEHMSASAKADPIPYQKIVESYNDNLPTLRRCIKVTDKVRNTIRKSWNADKRHQSLEFWQRYFSALPRLTKRMEFWAGTDGANSKQGIDLVARKDIFERSIEELMDLNR